jgi:hypothetical protein
MKVSSWLTLLAMAGALALQGCAGTGDVTYGKGAAPAPADSSSPDRRQPVVNADTKQNFEAVVAAIHREMQPGGRWQYVDNAGREVVDGRFADMRSLFDQFGTVDKMDPTGRSRLIDDQNAVNEVLAKDDANRMVCEEVAPTGSHITKTICRTYGQIRIDQENAKFNVRVQGVQSTTQKVRGN